MKKLLDVLKVFIPATIGAFIAKLIVYKFTFKMQVIYDSLAVAVGVTIGYFLFYFLYNKLNKKH